MPRLLVLAWVSVQWLSMAVAALAKWLPLKLQMPDDGQDEGPDSSVDHQQWDLCKLLGLRVFLCEMDTHRVLKDCM